MEQYIVRNQKKLRCGYTTGTCAAAAARAAAQRLLLGIVAESVAVHAPKGVLVNVPVSLMLDSKDKTEYRAVKDSGDDPDVTNRARIYASVERLAEEEAGSLAYVFEDARYPGLYLDGGEGIGRITREGLEQKPGYAAINAVPRDMIFRAVGETRTAAEAQDALLIRVRVPGGEELALRTFNPRLGIEGGISILGTSGIVEPMSERAIVDTIEAQIRQLHVQGERKLLVVPGNYGQGYAERFLDMDMGRGVQCSNYIGEALDLAVAYGMEAFLLAGNIGKLVKLAGGIMNTHSRVADARCEIFAAHAALCGGSREMVGAIMECITTDEILGLLDAQGLREPVMQSLCGRIQEVLLHRVGKQLAFGVILFSERFGFLGQTKDAAAVLEQFRNHS